MNYITDKASMAILASKDIAANEKAFFETTGMQKALHATLIVKESKKENHKISAGTIDGITKYYVLCIMEIEKRQGLNEGEALEMFRKYYQDMKTEINKEEV